MTIKELKERLNDFPDDLIVMVPNIAWDPFNKQPQDVPAKNVVRGVNETDICVFIDAYEED